MVLIIAEVASGQLKKNTPELITAAAALAQGKPISLALVGPTASALAAELSATGIATIYTFADPGLEPPTAQRMVEALAPFITDKGFTTVLAGHSTESRDFMPRLAERLGGALVPDITAIDTTSGKLMLTRPVLSGKGIATVEVATQPICITIRPNAFAASTAAGSPSVEAVSTSVTAAARTILEVLTGGGSGKAELSEAEIIVSGGRGIKGPENWGPIQDLADALGGALGASRAVVDAGWIEHSHQVGQTGKTVSPKLYIACGISGAIQHLAGMSSSKYIVAINNNPDAPIFKIADFGIVGDMFEILPQLTAAIKAAKS